MPPLDQDVYVYLARGAHRAWTIQEVRGSGVLSDATVKVWSQVGAEAADTFSIAEAEVEMARERILLVATSDEVPIAHFRAKKSLFDTIKPALTDPNENASHFDTAHVGLGKLLAAAGIQYDDRIVVSGCDARRKGCSARDCFTLVIAANTFFRAGYFHMQQLDRVPQMSANDYIVIRPLGEGWYFFRQF